MVAETSHLVASAPSLAPDCDSRHILCCFLLWVFFDLRVWAGVEGCRSAPYRPVALGAERVFFLHTVLARRVVTVVCDCRSPAVGLAVVKACAPCPCPCCHMVIDLAEVAAAVEGLLARHMHLLFCHLVVDLDCHRWGTEQAVRVTFYDLPCCRAFLVCPVSRSCSRSRLTDCCPLGMDLDSLHHQHSRRDSRHSLVSQHSRSRRKGCSHSSGPAAPERE